MACQRPSPIVTFEHDVSGITFQVYLGGVAVRDFNNYQPQLHLVDPNGVHVLKVIMADAGGGRVSGTTEHEGGIAAFYEAIEALDRNVHYNCQLFLKYVVPPSFELGLLDYIDPYWMDYIPPEDLVLGNHSGEVKVDRTAVTPIIWSIYESYRLRGTGNG